MLESILIPLYEGIKLFRDHFIVVEEINDNIFNKSWYVFIVTLLYHFLQRLKKVATLLDNICTSFFADCVLL